MNGKVSRAKKYSSWRSTDIVTNTNSGLQQGHLSRSVIYNLQIKTVYDTKTIHLDYVYETLINIESFAIFLQNKLVDTRLIAKNFNLLYRLMIFLSISGTPQAQWGVYIPARLCLIAAKYTTHISTCKGHYASCWIDARRHLGLMSHNGQKSVWWVHLPKMIM